MGECIIGRISALPLPPPPIRYREQLNKTLTKKKNSSDDLSLPAPISPCGGNKIIAKPYSYEPRASLPASLYGYNLLENRLGFFSSEIKMGSEPRACPLYPTPYPRRQLPYSPFLRHAFQASRFSFLKHTTPVISSPNPFLWHAFQPPDLPTVSTLRSNP